MMLRLRSMNSPTPDIVEYHFCRLFPGDKPALSLTRHQHYLYSKLGVKPGQRGLHIGCGNGTISLELVRFSNVTVVGVDTDQEKVREANRLAQRHLVEHRMKFLHVTDYLTMSSALMSENPFDFVFSIESLKHEHDFTEIYRYLSSFLRPGGRLGVYEWCWSNLFDPANPDHCRLANVFETSAGLAPRLPYDRSIPAAIHALQLADMHVIACDDLASRADMIPWYTPLRNALASDTSTQLFEHHLFGGLSRAAAGVVVESAILKLFTPMVLLVARKNEAACL